MTANIPLVIILFLLVGTCTCKQIFIINSPNDPLGAEDDLVAVVVLYRHGDRSPIASFPTDPYYNSSYWPEGYGQLLKKGVARQYELGQWLRDRYTSFLPAEYSPKDILVYSTDVDRTLMSAQANLAGLYPPPDSQVWEEGFLWEPIPVHRLATYDPILTMNGNCPKFEEELKQLETTDFFKNISVEYSDFFSELSKYTGMNVSSAGDVARIYDVYYVYKNHNESFIPSWMHNIDMENLRYLAGLDLAKVTFTNGLKRLRGGPFVNYLINYFDNVINNVTDTTKFLMLSAHDSTVTTVLRSMGYIDYYPPEFASIVMWELRKNSTDHYVNVLYRSNSNSNFIDKVNITNCDYNCTFGDFKINLKNVNVDLDTWEKECQTNLNGSIQIIVSWSLLLITVVMQKIA